ncbi:MAG: hypothetical protein EXS58_08350 [Candidatus Latescibacteria bacterium]|nr:hypothetical protein [Candidatus Latescibacterota bacterium]
MECQTALTFCLILGASAASAGGGWVSAPGAGYLQSGISWKDQPGAQRRDIEGQSYVALSHLNHTLSFAYLAGQVGLYPRLKASFSLFYLWASERFDDAAEEPDITFQGFSDLWVGLKLCCHRALRRALGPGGAEKLLPETAYRSGHLCHQDRADL